MGDLHHSPSWVTVEVTVTVTVGVGAMPRYLPQKPPMHLLNSTRGQLQSCVHLRQAAAIIIDQQFRLVERTLLGAHRQIRHENTVVK